MLKKFNIKKITKLEFFLKKCACIKFYGRQRTKISRVLFFTVNFKFAKFVKLSTRKDLGF